MLFLKVNFPIVVTQLGVFDSKSDGFQGGLTVRLFDRISQVCQCNSNYTVILYSEGCNSRLSSFAIIVSSQP